MTDQTGYNGHKNWTHWNVALWIGNDEGLYRMAMAIIESTRTLDRAAHRFQSELTGSGITRTPDGARYSLAAIRAALGGLKD